ncbi:CAP domain-containing protein [Patulibacter defluvii]|uniref:CAP domain-containing protein n=1 Tax=Patulibacter defluvii TaxID=3095358 RepID=UPI002A752656|nr:CAP domain-containing protein [Patulibacter sp. DM4]
MSLASVRPLPLFLALVAGAIGGVGGGVGVPAASAPTPAAGAVAGTSACGGHGRAATRCATARRRIALRRVAQRDCPDADLQPSAENLERVRSATACLVARERARRGIGGLGNRQVLRRMADGYARLMVREDFFGHVTPSGVSFSRRIAAAGYPPRRRAWRAGENLAWGTGKMATPRDVVRRWMASPGHRRNLLDRAFDETGIGIALGAPGVAATGRTAATYVQVLGARG